MGQLPSRKSPTIAAATSDPGMTFAARHCRYNVCNGSGAINDLQACVGNVSRLHAATQALGIITRALASTMIIAVETEAAAMAKWEHYKAGTGLEAIARAVGTSLRRQDGDRQFAFAAPSEGGADTEERIDFIGSSRLCDRGSAPRHGPLHE